MGLRTIYYVRTKEQTIEKDNCCILTYLKLRNIIRLKNMNTNKIEKQDQGTRMKTENNARTKEKIIDKEHCITLNNLKLRNIIVDLGP